MSTLAPLHHATLSHLRALGFRTVMRATATGRRAHAAMRWDHDTITVVLPATDRHDGCAIRMTKKNGHLTTLASAFQVDPLCLMTVVNRMIDGEELTNTMHNPDCACPSDN